MKHALEGIRVVELGEGVSAAYCARSRFCRIGPDAAPARVVLADQPGVEVGVDRHLLAGHRVQGESGAHLGDALGALGDDDEVDDD